MNLKQILPATGRNTPIEFRLFETSLAITLAILYFYTVYGVILGYQWPILTVYSSASVIYTGLYVAQKSGLPFRMLTMIYYLIAFALLALAWLPSGGMRGVITNMFVLIFVSGLLILNPTDFLVFFTVSLLLVLGYTVLEGFYPDAAAPYLDEKKLMMDISVSNLIMLSVLGVTIYIFKKEYLRDKRRIKITNQRLEQEKGKAEAADKAKSLFLANISHEMRTPLNGIAGSSELLKHTNLNSGQRQILTNLSSSNELLNSLISDVLDITMLESGRLVLAANEFSPQKLLQEVIESLKPQLDSISERVSFSYFISPEVPVLGIGDEDRIRRILIHLMKNALKFTNSGSVTVGTTSVKTVEGYSLIRYEVSDTGRGVKDQDRENIFQPFHNFIADEDKRGLGIGLHICKKLAEAMGGRMGLEPGGSNGSVFYFEVPLKVAGSAEEAKIEHCLKSIKVLIAEDQQINQVITKKMLQNLGVINIDIAENGQDALEKYLINFYDLILMDLRMPLMDGIEATREILAKSGGHNPAIIAVTANALEMDKEKCLKVGMLDFINKPFTKEVLAKSIQNALNTRQVEV